MQKIDVNADLGEIDDDGLVDAQLLTVITSANVACGGHAGDSISMQRVCALAAEHGVAIGAQVSYVDRAGFGRRQLDVDPATLQEQLLQQVVDLTHAASIAGTSVRYIKPHGALYHAAIDDHAVAEVLVNLARHTSLALLTMSDGHLYNQANDHGVAVFTEAFLDRGYSPAGRLLPRDDPNALLEPDAALHRLRTWATSGALNSQSLCVHSDSPGAVEIARSASALLQELDIVLAPFTTPFTTPT